MASFGTLLFTWFNGQKVGTDVNGNCYYTAKSAIKGQQRVKRWVIYNGKNEASTVPSEWHAWLHYTTDAPLTGVARQAWQKPHEANQTGTANAYFPPGHELRGGQRDRAAGDYQAWQP